MSCHLPALSSEFSALSSQLRVGDVPVLTIDQSVELSIIWRMTGDRIRDKVEQEPKLCTVGQNGDGFVANTSPDPYT